MELPTLLPYLAEATISHILPTKYPKDDIATHSSKKSADKKSANENQLSPDTSELPNDIRTALRPRPGTVEEELMMNPNQR